MTSKFYHDKENPPFSPIASPSTEGLLAPRFDHPQKINLLVRTRPLLPTERSLECLTPTSGNSLRLTREYHQVTFKFDNMLDQNDDQIVAFDRIYYLVTYFLLGISGTVFAYGQTGAGKTYSIFGDDHTLQNELRGVLPRAVESIFTYREQ